MRLIKVYSDIITLQSIDAKAISMQVNWCACWERLSRAAEYLRLYRW